MSHNRDLLRRVLGCFLTITIAVVLSCAVVYQIFRSLPTPSTEIRQLTEALLQASTYPRPTNIYGKVPHGSDICINVLSEVMKKNNNHYTIIIKGVWGDGASPIPGGTGAIEAVVHVVFPDSTHIELQYYAYGLDVCKQIHGPIEEF